jgi:hypothetical protein
MKPVMDEKMLFQSMRHTMVEHFLCLICLMQKKSIKVSISPAFYAQLFCTSVFRATFFVLEFWLDTFLEQQFSGKAALKIMVKLATGHETAGSPQGREKR